MSSVVQRVVDPFAVRLWRGCEWPRQTLREMRLFRDLLLSYDHPRVWEWGSGRSTSYYTRLLHRAGHPYEWHAVDHTPRWLEQVRRWVGDTPNVCLYSSPFRNPSEIGDPCFADHPDKEAIQRYIDYPLSLGQFDFVLIDGRFRRRCAQVAPQIVAPGGTIILHDAQREHYAGALAGRVIHSKYLPAATMRQQVVIARA